jgi:hypothetical protein
MSRYLPSKIFLLISLFFLNPLKPTLIDSRQKLGG